MPIIRLGGGKAAGNGEDSELDGAGLSALSTRRSSCMPPARSAVQNKAANAAVIVQHDEGPTVVQKDGLAFRDRFGRNIQQADESAAARAADHKEKNESIDKIKDTESKLRLIRQPTRTSFPGELFGSSSPSSSGWAGLAIKKRPQQVNSSIGPSGWSSLPPQITELLQDMEIADGTEINVIKTLEQLEYTVSEVMQWKDELIASESMPITALVPLTILCAKLMRMRENHKQATDMLLRQVGQLAPRALLDERGLLLKRIADLESENQELSGQEEARILMEKVHKSDIASCKWNILVEKMLRQDERRQHRVVRWNLGRRNTVLQERLTKFADGQRLRSKAGGARVLSYEVLQLLSPRTATPVVSDDEGDIGPAARMRLERVKTQLEGHKARTAESLTEPGMLGILETNRAGTPRDTSHAMTNSITKSLNTVTFEEVVKTPEIAPYPYTGFTDQGVPGSHWQKFRPSSIGWTLPADDGQSLQSINEQWVALFDGGGTDPGHTGAKPASPDGPNNREENVNSTDPGYDTGARPASPDDPNNREGLKDSNAEETNVTAAIPFISARPPGSRGGSRGSRGIRYRQSKYTAEELMQAHQPHISGSKDDEGPGYEPQEGLCLDSAREMVDNVPSGGPVHGNVLPRPMVPNLDLRVLNMADSAAMAGEQPGPESSAGSQRRRLDGELQETQTSKFDRDMVPRGDLLELKLKHSLQVRAMQRAFEERLQIMNQYWCDKGVTLLDNKTAAMTRLPYGSSTSRSLPGSGTGYRHGSPPTRRQSISPVRQSTPASRDSPRKFEINWEKRIQRDRSFGDGKPPESKQSISTGMGAMPPQTVRPSTSDQIYGAGTSSLPRPFTSSGVPMEDVRDSVQPRYHAFIYPGRRRLASYTENKQELANHRIKSHEVKHSVKPFKHHVKVVKKTPSSIS